jgi:hypothetical protein
MDADLERSIRLKLRTDYLHYASKCLFIRLKSGNLIPFQLNKAQRHIHGIVEQQKRETGKVRIIIVKGRQQGCSTYIEGRFYWLGTHNIGIRAFILTHAVEATDNLFEMAQRFHENCPRVVRPRIKASNAKELVFADIDSGYKLGTAGNKATGRSSTIQLLHGSEVAYWPNAAEHAKGIMQAVPNADGTEIFLESTANGIGNYFHEQWQLAKKGIGQFIPIFVPWFWQDEYCIRTNDEFIADDEEESLIDYYKLSYDQLEWRRHKIIELSVGGIDGTKAFQQEYPCTPVEAFTFSGEDTFISASLVMQARKSLATASGNLVVGVDPARFGDDRTSIIFRRGRVAYGLRSFQKKDTMEVAGIVHRIIIDEAPSKVCIDIGGLGAGVFDRLKELGHGNIICAVNGGSTPLNQEKYINKRAEMWGLMKEWLLDFPCQIPDNDSLHADLCTIRYKFDSKTRLALERKEDMKKRGIRSPDEGDALALTFALPDFALGKSQDIDYENIAKDMGSHFGRLDRLRKDAYK